VGQGPASPLWQQKFQPTAHPCAGVDAVPPRPDAGEEVLPDDTAQQLRTHAGTLNLLFNRCDDWEKPVPRGIYVVVCDQGALDRFFKSGLTDLSTGTITFQRAGEKPAAPTIPAVFRRPAMSDLDGLGFRTTSDATADVYATCFAGGQPVTAVFRGVRLLPGAQAVLHTGEATWTLSGTGAPAPSVTPETKAKTPRCGASAG
jgi:hypothetical protein